MNTNIKPEQRKMFKKELTKRLISLFLGQKSPVVIRIQSSGQIIVSAGKKITLRMIRRIVDNYQKIDMDPSATRVFYVNAISKSEEAVMLNKAA